MSEKGPFIWFRMLGVLLLLGLVAAGGFMAYKVGVAQGVSQAPEVATAISQAAENGAGNPMMYGPGYGYRMHGFHHFGFFPFGAICGSILFLFFFFGFMKMIFFRPWCGGWGHHHKHGPWSRHWEDGVPSMFDEWHKRAHGEKPADSTDKKE